ncbi:MAG: BlaI/MecI/CopY family transcriptional regulator [Myxococcaceae bacterium]|nr:MAG: BlaI/MecI/CopY family transcriptional regulator [Myxococcaceae bacterium]
MNETPIPGGQLERAILEALWDRPCASAREVHGVVGAAESLAYTTVATVLDRLHAKGLVTRDLVGRAFVYRAAVARASVEQAQVRALLAKLLGPSPRPAVAALVEAVEALDPALLDDLARAVAARRRSRRGP